jgi:hypothetical protein
MAGCYPASRQRLGLASAAQAPGAQAGRGRDGLRRVVALEPPRTEGLHGEPGPGGLWPPTHTARRGAGRGLARGPMRPGVLGTPTLRAGSPADLVGRGREAYRSIRRIDNRSGRSTVAPSSRRVVSRLPLAGDDDAVRGCGRHHASSPSARPSGRSDCSRPREAIKARRAAHAWVATACVAASRARSRFDVGAARFPGRSGASGRRLGRIAHDTIPQSRRAALGRSLGGVPDHRGTEPLARLTSINVLPAPDDATTPPRPCGLWPMPALSFAL